MMQRLCADNLYKKYKDKSIVNGISFEALSGQITGVVGPNGAGKTTFFYMLMGLVKPDSGSVLLNDLDITDLPLYQRARIGLGYLPQDVSIFRGLTVGQNIMSVLEVKYSNKDERQQMLQDILSEFEIKHLSNEIANSLSGGQRRRVEIARIMAMQPQFLLLDEPFAGVDPIAISEIKNIIINLKHKGMGVIITDHNVRDAFSMTDCAYVVYDGKILTHGKVDDIIKNEMVKDVYLGESFAGGV